MPAMLPPSYFRFRGLLAMAFFSVGLLSVFTAFGAAAFWGAGGWRTSVVPAVSGISALALASLLLRARPNPLPLYASAAASLGMLTFNTTLLASNSELWINPLSLHSRSSAIVFWLLAFAASAYLLAVGSRGQHGAVAPPEQAGGPLGASPAERSCLLFSGVVALAMIESRLENVVGFLYLLPSLDQVKSLAALAGSFLGGALTVFVGALLLAGPSSRFVSGTALLLSLLFLGSNAVAYATGVASSIESEASGGSALARLSFQSLLYWSAVSYCAYRIVRCQRKENAAC